MTQQINTVFTFEDLYAQTDRLINPENSTTRYFFVAAHTINGGRFYSETFTDCLDAIDIYYSYCDIIKYFGGGIVELFRIDENDFDIISVSRI